MGAPENVDVIWRPTRKKRRLHPATEFCADRWLHWYRWCWWRRDRTALTIWASSWRRSRIWSSYPSNIHPLIEAPGIDQPEGVLLYGSPGTGETLVARAVARHTRCSFISFGLSDGTGFVGHFHGWNRFGPLRFLGRQRAMIELLGQLDGFKPTSNIKVIMAI